VGGYGNVFGAIGMMDIREILGGPKSFQPGMISAGTYSSFFIMNDGMFNMTNTHQGPGGSSHIKGNTFSLELAVSDNTTYSSGILLEELASSISYVTPDYNQSIGLATQSIAINRQDSINNELTQITLNGNGIGLRLGTFSNTFDITNDSPGNKLLFSVSGEGKLTATISQMGGPGGMLIMLMPE